MIEFHRRKDTPPVHTYSASLPKSDLYFQGIHPLTRHLDTSGFEALIRFGQFPLEPTISDILYRSPHTLTQATCDLVRRDFHKLPKNAYLTLNFAPEQILFSQFKDALKDLARKINPKKTVIEITEGNNKTKYDAVQVCQVVENLNKRLGYRVAIDDFPTGISPVLIDYFSKRKVNYILKMDGSFLQNTIKLDEIPRLANISKNHSIVFERISSYATHRQVQSFTSTHGLKEENIFCQGYFYDRPAPLTKT